MLHMLEGNRRVCSRIPLTESQLRSAKKKNPTEFNRCRGCRQNLPSLHSMNVDMDNIYMQKHFTSLGEQQ